MQLVTAQILWTHNIVIMEKARKLKLTDVGQIIELHIGDIEKQEDNKNNN